MKQSPGAQSPASTDKPNTLEGKSQRSRSAALGSFRSAPHLPKQGALCSVALTQRARPVTRGRRQDICSRLPQVSAQRTRHRGRSKSKGQDVRTAPRLSLWIRAPRLLRRAARICVGAAPGLRPTSTQSCGTTNTHSKCGTRAAAAAVGRPPAREPRKERTALLLDAGRRTKLEGSCGCSRDVAVGDRRGEARYEALGRSSGTAVARAPREVAGFPTTGASRDCEGFDRPTVAVVRRRGRPPKTAGQ